ncbi:MAG TPA: cation diffusion facilitator family transporter [Chloroflexota bacterium]|nr:cation diffusion facilitator family transporter [Chloroflexota bacterium]
MEQVTAGGGRLRLALGLTLAVLVVEVAGGLVSHSLALLSDAGHVLTDVFALGLAWFAVVQARRPADRRRSYGYHRVSVLAAFVNAITLIVIVLAIAFEAVRRLMAPSQVEGGIVIATALVAIAMNTFVLTTLRAENQNLNLRAALLHVTGDLAAAAGVVVAGAVILLTGWTYIDPLLSLAIAALIAYSAFGIVRETSNLLIEGTPRSVDLAAVSRKITGTRLVTGVHDLHVWALSPDETALSCHIVIDDTSLGNAEHVVREIENRLCEEFSIGHTTIQVESCHPCGDIQHGAGEHNHPHRVFTA